MWDRCAGLTCSPLPATGAKGRHRGSREEKTWYGGEVLVGHSRVRDGKAKERVWAQEAAGIASKSVHGMRLAGKETWTRLCWCTQRTWLCLIKEWCDGTLMVRKELGHDS